MLQISWRPRQPKSRIRIIDENLPGPPTIGGLNSTYYEVLMYRTGISDAIDRWDCHKRALFFGVIRRTHKWTKFGKANDGKMTKFCMKCAATQTRGGMFRHGGIL